MKKTNLLLIIIISFMLLVNSLIAQTPNWLWATSGSGVGGEGISVSRTDAAGNIYSAGAFSGTNVTLGSFTLSHASYNNGGYYGDLFISKQDAAGNFLWAITPTAVDSIGTTAIFNSLSVDGSGNVYVCLGFQAVHATSAIVFGNDTLFSGSPGGFLYMVKFDTNGNLLWAKKYYKKQGVGSGGGSTKSVIDNAGNYIVMGMFGVADTAITFDTDTIFNPHLGSVAEIWLAKLDPSGNVLWTRTAGGPGMDLPNDIDADNNGNFYILGGFSSDTIYFSPSVYLVNSLGGGLAFPQDAYYAKYDSNGNPVWAKRIVYGVATGIFFPLWNAALNQAGEYYITGMYKIPSLTIGTTLLNAPGMFITKCDVNGTPVWAHLFGDSIKTGNIFDMQSDASGNMIVLAQFSEDSLSIGGVELINAGGSSNTVDIALAKLDAAGNPLWALRYGGDAQEAGKLAVNPTGNINVTGSFKSQTLVLGSTTLTNTDFPNNDTYFAALNNPLGILSLQNKNNSIEVFPNPATDKINFNLGFKSSTCTSVSVMNVLGETVLEACIVDATTGTFDIRKLKTGLYVMKIEGEKGIYSQKFLKE